MTMAKAQTLTEVTASGVLGEFTYSLVFPDSSDSGRMRLVYAPNGRGKSNLLRAIAALLNPSPESLQTLIEVPIRTLRISFSNGGFVRMERLETVVGSYELIVSASEGDPESSVVVDPADFAGRLYKRVLDERKDYSGFFLKMQDLSPGAIYVGDDRLTASIDEGREIGRGEAIRHLAKSRGPVNMLLQSVERMLMRAAISGLSNEKTHGTGIYSQITRTTLKGAKNMTTTDARTALQNQIAEIVETGRPLETYGLLSLRQVNDISAQVQIARANNSRLPVLQRILEPYLASISKQIEDTQSIHDLIDTYVTAVNRFLDRKSLQFTANFGIKLVDRTGDSIDPEALSSGERHLIVLLTQAVLATANRPVLLIDEPEISLGIEWQRDLLPELLRCSGSGQLQFIVASHSLQIMNAVDRSSITQPEED